MPLLSICIPTYNRSHLLKQCLENIAIQLSDDIEVVISDNASEDNTPALVAEYQSRFRNIKYFRNEKNVGLDENIINSIVTAEGKYCWNIGDDDLIQNGALKLITEILAAKEISLLTVNFNPFIDIQRSLEPKEFPKDATYVDDKEDFYARGFAQGILGIFIFNRALWLQTDRSNYERHWSYYEILLRMMGLAHLPFAYTANSLIYMGQDYRWNKGGTAFSVLIHIKRLMAKLKTYGYSDTFVNNEMARLSNQLPRTLLSAKSYDLPFSFKNLALMYKEFYFRPDILLLATTIFFIPNAVVKLAKRIRNKKHG